ncbi:hypothetical protein HYFRA_00006912 [Hymenoscyphus fraxineus]|uniref:Uncharacterized protein n=1 Tax=Hymenoscyphus fraxineus TaxID=746836 RepID=A0A9N9KNX2_9HELO|nr:hypothetical protein HYFRA_00006912 [Hymenoscyphus fraxineus]
MSSLNPEFGCPPSVTVQNPDPATLLYHKTNCTLTAVCVNPLHDSKPCGRTAATPVRLGHPHLHRPSKSLISAFPPIIQAFPESPNATPIPMNPPIVPFSDFWVRVWVRANVDPNNAKTPKSTREIRISYPQSFLIFRFAG